MIYYFSGTGNSAYVARRLAEKLGEEAQDLLPKLRSRDHTPVNSARPFVFVAPVYGWQLPHLVRDWLRATPLAGSREAYFVLTCGGGIGGAGLYTQKLCEEKQLRCRGTAQILMPENYVAMFPVPEEDAARAIIARAEPAIDAAADCIAQGRDLPARPGGVGNWFSSTVVNPAFCKLLVKDTKFYATDACISCGICTQVCPLNNVRLAGGKPVWQGNCTHCMACLCRCPRAAIEYGRASRGKPRYLCPEE